MSARPSRRLKKSCEAGMEGREGREGREQRRGRSGGSEKTSCAHPTFRSHFGVKTGAAFVSAGIFLGALSQTSISFPLGFLGSRVMSKLTAPSDRAESYRRPGNVRKHLSMLGFHPYNRGGMGISSHHAHECGWDCMDSRVRLQRYGHAKVVEVPNDCMEEFRRTNKNKCRGDPFMPAFSEDMCLALLTKTHFVHGLKLAADGHHYLFNDTSEKAGGGRKISLKADDAEGQLTLREGVICVVYGAELWRDSEAMTALMSEDNMNSCVTMAEDTMAKYGCVDMVMENLIKAKQKDAEKNKGDGEKKLEPLTEKDVLMGVKAMGGAGYTESDILCLIRFRMQIDPLTSQVYVGMFFLFGGGVPSPGPFSPFHPDPPCSSSRFSPHAPPSLFSPPASRDSRASHSFCERSSSLSWVVA